MIEPLWNTSYLAIIGKSELVPCDWLEKFVLPDRTDYAWDGLRNEISMEDFGDHIQTHGLLHEAVLEVSRKTRRTRLVAGNHRIQVLSKTNDPRMPVYVAIVDEFNFEQEPEDGITVELTSIVDTTSGFCISAPSRVFKDEY